MVFLLEITLYQAEGDYDAAEIDKELVASRLKRDVLEHSGRVHLFIADSVRTFIPFHVES